jgi:hypothetical protein
MKDMNRERPRFWRGICPAIVHRCEIELAAGWRGFRFQNVAAGD